MTSKQLEVLVPPAILVLALLACLMPLCDWIAHTNELLRDLGDARPECMGRTNACRHEDKCVQAAACL